MTDQEARDLEYAKSIIVERCLPKPPAVWILQPAKDEEDGETRAKFQLDGYVLAANDRLDFGAGYHHFVFADRQINNFEHEFVNTELGGVMCRYLNPNQIAGVYLRQFHFAGEPDWFDWLKIKSAVGTPVRIRIIGKIWISARGEVESPADDFGRFRTFDRSNRCPLISTSSPLKIRVLGKFRQGGISISIPFTKMHFGLTLTCYFHP